MCATGLFVGVAGCTSSDSNGNGGDGTTDEDAPGQEQRGSEEQLDEEQLVPVNWPQSYVADSTHIAWGDQQYGAPAGGTSTLRVRDRNVHLKVSYDGGYAIETYVVDGTVYTIVGGMCTKESGDPDDVMTGDVPEMYESELPVTATTTIDGQPVYIHEVTDTMSGTVRWYIHQETGYPVRFESDHIETTYHSWGAVEPIEPPAMECHTP